MKKRKHVRFSTSSFTKMLLSEGAKFYLFAPENLDLADIFLIKRVLDRELKNIAYEEKHFN